ncbi:MAG: MFS transporter [Candidatus Bathyarchaeia archaeon]|jgi:MFS family permease
MKKTDSNESNSNSRRAKFFGSNIAVIASSSAVNGFGTGMISYYASLYFVSIGGDPIRLGILTSISILIQCLVLFLGGRIADHYGRRKVIVIAAFYAILFPTLYALIPDWRIFVATAAIGAFGAVSSPASHATVADSIPAEKRTTGISTLQVVSTFPMIFSPLIGGLLIEIYGLQSGFRLASAFVAGTTLVSAVILLLFLKETMRQRHGQESRVSANSTVSIRGRLSARSLHSLVALLFSYGLIAFANALVSSYYILYATQVIGLDAPHYGIIVSLQILLTILLKIPGGWASDRFGKKKMMIVSILTCTPCVVMFTFSRSFLQAAITIIVLTITGMYYAPSYEALQADLTPREIRGRVTSFWDISGAVGGALGASLGGIFFQTISPATPFYAFAVVEVVAALLILVAVKEPQQAED